MRANLKTLGQGISAQVAATLASGDRLLQRSRMVSFSAGFQGINPWSGLRQSSDGTLQRRLVFVGVWAGHQHPGGCHIGYQALPASAHASLPLHACTQIVATRPDMLCELMLRGKASAHKLSRLQERDTCSMHRQSQCCWTGSQAQTQKLGTQTPEHTQSPVTSCCRPHSIALCADSGVEAPNAVRASAAGRGPRRRRGCPGRRHVHGHRLLRPAAAGVLGRACRQQRPASWPAQGADQCCLPTVLLHWQRPAWQNSCCRDLGLEEAALLSLPKLLTWHCWPAVPLQQQRLGRCSRDCLQGAVQSSATCWLAGQHSAQADGIWTDL